MRDRDEDIDEDQTHVTEGGTHDDGLVTVLLVVVEDLLHGLDTRVLITLVVLASALLVPIKDLDRPRASQRVSQRVQRSSSDRLGAKMKSDAHVRRMVRSE